MGHRPEQPQTPTHRSRPLNPGRSNAVTGRVAAVLLAMMMVVSACGFEYGPPQFDCECDELLTLAESIDWIPGQEPTLDFHWITFRDLDDARRSWRVTTPNREGPDFRAVYESTGDFSIRLAFGGLDRC